MNNTENNVTQYPNSIETRVALVEMSIVNINQTLIRIEKRFDKIDDRFDKVEKEMKTDFRWIIAGFAGILAVMAHGFHWI